MTLDFTKLIENSIRKEMTVSHLDGRVKAQTIDSLPEKVKTKISEQYGEKYLGDADYVVVFKGPFDREDNGKLYKLTNRALGVDANRMTEEDFKFIKLDHETPWRPDDENDEARDDENDEARDDENGEAPYAPPADEVEPDEDAGTEDDAEGDFEPPEDEVEPDEDDEEELDECGKNDDNIEIVDDDDYDYEAEYNSSLPPEQRKTLVRRSEIDECDENPDDWKADKLDVGQDDWDAEHDPKARVPYDGPAKKDKLVDEDEDFEPPADEVEPDEDDEDESGEQAETEPATKPTAFAFLKITMK